MDQRPIPRTPYDFQLLSGRPIAGPKRLPTVHLGPQSQSGCNWQATYLPSPFPPGAVSVTNYALRSPSVKIATQGWAHGQLPGTVRTTVLGRPAYYRTQDAGNYKNEMMFALVGNLAWTPTWGA